MEIKKPTTTVPPRRAKREKYTALREALKTLKPGEWLPVECADEKEAHLLSYYCAPSQGLGRVAIAQRRGLTVYVTRRNGT